ncbi:MAG: DNA gyrase subunit A [Bacteriovoracaceae bacterium]|nr:DNA gyrase subunit A [Bacteriovoracaceae bacterium]
MADNNNETPTPSNVAPVFIQDEMRSCYLDYAMSVIIGRALPDVRDGLKPVHRRVLYAMHSMGNYHNKPFLKSARVVGDVIGKYHPHGDSAVYNTIVRLAQDFSMRYQLVDGQGNFGSIDGDSAAAMRYTEIRMKKLTEEMLKDLDKETVEWQPNYDDSLKEPRVLPTRVPNLLVNGSAGIAVGMATNIPPHNLSEIMKGLLLLLEDETTTINQLMEIIPGPDFPTAGTIHGTEGIKSAYHTGKGVLQIRAKTDIESHGKSGDRERIVIHELPYQVNKAKLIEKIAELVNAKQIVGISDIRDESSREGIRVALDLKKGEIGTVILNRLYKHTQLQTSFGIIFLSISNGSPKVMNIKEQLLAFIDHRREVVIRRTVFELKKAKEKAHILEGLKTAVENIDELVELIKKSEGPAQARQKLMSTYSLSEIQSQAILDMRLQRLTGLERDKIIADYEAIMKEIARLESILQSEDLIKGIIKDEFNEILESYGDERRTDIIAKADEIQIQDLVKEEEVIVTVTHKGYIKRMATDTYKTQKRGGTGVKGANSDDDFFTNIFTANTHSTLYFFTSRGTVFSKKVYTVPEGSRTNKGRNIANLIQIPSGEKIKEIICLPDDKDIDGKFLLFATERGLVKKSSLSDYKNIKQSGLRAIKIIDGDNLLNVRVTTGEHDVLLCSSSGKIIRFSEEDCRPMGRVSQGVKGINIDESEKIIGMEIIDDNVEILSVTENGYGKRTSASQYRKQTRGGKGILAMRLTEKNGEICAIKPVTEEDDLMIITDKGQVIRTKISGISLMGRATQGVRIIRLKDGEKVVAVENIVEEDEE